MKIGCNDEFSGKGRRRELIEAKFREFEKIRKEGSSSFHLKKRPNSIHLTEMSILLPFI